MGNGFLYMQLSHPPPRNRNDSEFPIRVAFKSQAPVIRLLELLFHFGRSVETLGVRRGKEVGRGRENEKLLRADS